VVGPQRVDADQDDVPARPATARRQDERGARRGSGSVATRASHRPRERRAPPPSAPPSCRRRPRVSLGGGLRSLHPEPSGRGSGQCFPRQETACQRRRVYHLEQAQLGLCPAPAPLLELGQVLLSAEQAKRRCETMPALRLGVFALAAVGVAVLAASRPRPTAAASSRLSIGSTPRSRIAMAGWRIRDLSRGTLSRAGWRMMEWRDRCEELRAGAGT